MKKRMVAIIAFAVPIVASVILVVSADKPTATPSLPQQAGVVSDLPSPTLSDRLKVAGFALQKEAAIESENQPASQQYWKNGTTVVEIQQEGQNPPYILTVAVLQVDTAMGEQVFWCGVKPEHTQSPEEAISDFLVTHRNFLNEKSQLEEVYKVDDVVTYKVLRQSPPSCFVNYPAV